MSQSVPGQRPIPVAGLDDINLLPAGGETLGRYTLMYELAAGGMATLYLACVQGPAGFQKLVAIKRIHPHLAREQAFVEMFLDEARIAACIQHPNVAQIYELGQEAGQYFIVMEYVEGESVARLVRSYVKLRHQSGLSPTMQIREATAIVTEAAAGLHAAHELRGNDGQLLNLVHRDVSPHNVLLTYDGHVKLVDFGVAKARGRIATTTDRTLKGKIAYMSPEQVRAEEIDRRSDIFSLGVVLYELTCSRRLFKHEVEVETLASILRNEIVAPSQVIPGYPPVLEQIVMKALAFRRQDRFQSADDMHQALQLALREMGQPIGARELAALMQLTFNDRIPLKQRLREGGPNNELSRSDVQAVAARSDTLDFSIVTGTLRQAGIDLEAPRRRRRLIAMASALLTMALTVAIGWRLLQPGPTPAATSATAAALVQVNSSPANARVSVDRVARGTTPLRLTDLAIGQHSLVVELDGHARWERQLVIERAGQELFFDAILVAQVAQSQAAVASSAPAGKTPSGQRTPASGGTRDSRRATTSERGLLTLQTTPWAEVWIGQKKIGETPLIEVSVPAGRQKVLLLPKGVRPGRTVSITITPGEHVRKEIDLR